MAEDVFDALPPVPETLVIGGETLDITPLRVGEVPGFARAVRPIAGKIGQDTDWLRLLSEDGEAAIQAIAIACRRPPEWVSTLALDDAVRLAEAIFVANIDFFIRRVAPEIERASQTLGARINGLTSSHGLSDQATDTQTS